MIAGRCDRCHRWLRNPGTEVVIGRAVMVLGPKCLARVQGKPKREPVIPRTRVRRVREGQAELFGAAP